MAAGWAGLATVSGLAQERLHGDCHLAVFELGHKILEDIGTPGVTTTLVLSALGLADEFTIQIEGEPSELPRASPVSM